MVFFLASCLGSPAFAQIPTFTTPQTVQQTLAAAGTACTGAAQTYTITNLGQTQHYVYIKAVATQTTFLQMFGVDASGNQFLISDTLATGSIAALGTAPALVGTGYFPKIQIVVTCSPGTGTYTLSYTGTSATSNVISGAYQLAQSNKLIATLAPANATLQQTMQTPFGNTLGTMVFASAAGVPSGSTLSISCQGAGAAATGGFINNVYSLSTSVGQQVFNVPAGNCPIAIIAYNSGGASANSFSFEYIFMQPGTSLQNSYTHVTTTTATVAKSGLGNLHSLVVGTSAPGTISFFDLAPSACTGTPATNVVSVITEFASAAPPPPAYIFDVLFINGICVKASAAMDITVSTQ
jgi:hypothetical protein